MIPEQITLSKGTDLGVVAKLSTTWEKIAASLTKHKQTDHKIGSYFVGGYFSTKNRKTETLVARTLLTLDIDKVSLDVEEIELQLLLEIPQAFCAYTTYSHGLDDKSSVRVVLPLSREVTAGEYRLLSKAFSKTLSIKLDECSFKPNQPMFLPAAPNLDNVWSMINEGDAVNVDDFIGVGVVPMSGEVVEDALGDELESLIANQPLDLTLEEVKSYLAAYHADGLDYDAWLNVGAAINHQFQGSDQGYALWVGWSKKSSKHDEKMMPVKWRSFGKRVNNPVTFASIIYEVKQAGGVDTQEGGDFDQMLARAHDVDSLESYADFKEALRNTPKTVLPKDLRSMLANEIYVAWGKQAGISKTDIKSSIAPKEKPVSLSKNDAPKWLAPWVYIEKDCEFFNTKLNYSIKREAFNAKYDRQDDCVSGECQASMFALVRAPIKTVVGRMFFPSADMFFDYEGKLMVNEFCRGGVTPDETVSESGEAAIRGFLEHIALTLSDKREQEILLDWLCYVVQNQGKRVNWALLLQGAQGTGKTYFVNVLQAVMGDNVKNLDPSSIAGRFTGWAHGAIVNAVEEIRISGTNKYEVLDRMKPFITNDTVMIEEKGRDHRTVPNFTSYLLLTNHADAIPLVDGDRRYCVLFSRVQSESALFRELGGRDGAEAYFNKLFGDLQEHAGAIANFLMTRKVSENFKPSGRAPETNARKSMVQLAVSPEKSAVEDAIESQECAVINADLVDVTYLNELMGMENEELPSGRKLSAILLELGYKQIEGRKVKVSKNRRNHYVWIGACTDEEEAKKKVRDFHDDPNFVPF